LTVNTVHVWNSFLLTGQFFDTVCITQADPIFTNGSSQTHLSEGKAQKKGLRDLNPHPKGELPQNKKATK